MEKIKKLLQNQWENAWYNAKMFFKSHDITKITQFSLLFLPTALWIISISICNGFKMLDIISAILGVFALAYFIYYGKNQELFMEWGERYLDLYHEIESYYKNNDPHNKEKTEEFRQKISILNQEKKPQYHFFAKIRVEKAMDKEFTYQNEETPWYR